MALGITNRGTNTNNTSQTTLTVVPSGNLAASSMAVVCTAWDNPSSGTDITGVTDTKGNTWTILQKPLIDPSSAAAGQQGAIAVTNQNAGALTTGDTITITASAAKTAKTVVLLEVTVAAGKIAQYVTGGIGTSGTGTTSPTITTGTIPIGDAVIGMLALEAGTTEVITADSDSSNGSWSTQQAAQIGSTTSGSCCAAQGKVQTTTASAQTYNPGLSILGDLALGWIRLTEASRSSFFLVF